jgi:hypothetical protein
MMEGYDALFHLFLFKSSSMCRKYFHVLPKSLVMGISQPVRTSAEHIAKMTKLQ